MRNFMRTQKDISESKPVMNRAVQIILCIVLVNVSVWSADIPQVWGASYGKDHIAACVYHNSSLYVFTKNKLEVRNLASGAVQKTTLLDVTAGSTPLMLGDSMIIAGTDSSIGLYDSKTGRTIWKKELGAPQISDPVVYDGTLYAGVNGETTGVCGE